MEHVLQIFQLSHHETFCRNVLVVLSLGLFAKRTIYSSYGIDAVAAMNYSKHSPTVYCNLHFDALLINSYSYAKYRSFSLNSCPINLFSLMCIIDVPYIQSSFPSCRSGAPGPKVVSPGA